MPLGSVALVGDGGGMGHVIGVIPASGGVGATTFAAVLAVRAAETGHPVVAVDLDSFGGRLDVVLGVEQEPGWRWGQLRGVAGVVDGSGLARELPQSGPLHVLAGATRAAEPERSGTDGHPAGAWGTVVSDVVAGLAAAHRVTVLDLARDATVVESVAPLVDAWVVVAGSGVPQLAAAAMSVPLLRRLVDGACARASGAGGAPFAGAGLRRPCEPWLVLRGARIEDDIADAVCDHLDVPVVARVRDDLRLVSDVTGGVAPGSRGRGAVVEAADEILLRLVSRPPIELAMSPRPEGSRGRASGGTAPRDASVPGPTSPTSVPGPTGVPGTASVPGTGPGADAAERWRWSA